MADDKRVGPCHVFIGDPTTAAGADMLYLGHTRGDVRVAPNINVAFGRADQKGMTPLADGVFVTGPRPVATIPLLDEEKAKLLKQIPGGVLTTASGETALGFGNGFAKIALASIPTLCLLPIDETSQGTNGVDADHAIWFPACIVNGFGELVFNLPDGDDAFNPHEIQVTSLLRESDQDSSAIPTGHRAGWIGAPKALGLTWYLPAATP